MKYRYEYHPSKLSTLMVAYGAGSRANYKKYQDGMAHFMEHVRFKGTQKYSAKQLALKSAEFGGLSNAFTSEDIVAYHITIPDDNIEVAFDLLSEICLNPIFPADEIEKEKEVVAQECRIDLDDFDTRLYYRKMQNIFAGALSVPILGTEQSVKLITQEDIFRFNDEFYNDDQRLIILCSKTNRSDLVEKYFGKSNNKLMWKTPECPTYNQPSEDYMVDDGVLQQTISLSFAGDNLDKAFRDRAIFNVFNKIFGSGDVSRLFLKIREDLGMVYGINAHLTYHMDGNFYSINTKTEPKNTDKLLKELDNQISIIRNTFPTQQELNTAKNRIKADIYSRMDTSEDLVSIVLGQEFYGHSDIDSYLMAVQMVTKEDVKEIANLIFDNNRYLLIGKDKD